MPLLTPSSLPVGFVRRTKALLALIALTGGFLTATSVVAPREAVATPPVTVTPTFSIGSPDQSDAEFALAPGNWRNFRTQFPTDPIYTVGTSTPADWPYAQPGPGDSWGGSTVFRINYTLTSAQAAKDQILQLSFVDTETVPPTLSIGSNGTTVGSVTAPAGGGVGVYGKGTDSGGFGLLTRPHQVGILIPHANLLTGSNSLTITSTAGHWAAYDAVQLLPGPSSEGTVTVLSETPTPLIKKSGTQETQMVDIGVVNTSLVAQSTTFTATTNGVTGSATTTLSVPAGRSVQRIAVPPAPPAGSAELDIASQTSSESQATTYSMNLQYQQRWQLDLINGSHLDIGYAYDEATVRGLQNAYLDQAVAQCKATANYADNSRFRWTVEASWVVDNYLHDRSAAKIADLSDCIQAGQIEVTAGYNNNMQDLGSAEQLIRAVGHTTGSLATRFGVPVTSAVVDDVTGQTAQYIQMLHQQGVKVLINGSNGWHTGRRTTSPASTTTQDVPTLFNWGAPDGSKVLTFFGSGDYGQGYVLTSNYGNSSLKCLLAPYPTSGPNCPNSPARPAQALPYTPIAAPSQSTITTVADDLATGISSYLLPGLQVGKYPQSVYPLQLITDQNPPVTALSDVVDTFAQTYEWPKLSISTPSRFYADATTAQGDTSADGFSPDPLSQSASSLPTRTGDYTGWWSVGAASSAFETGENMQAQARTSGAETLASLGTLQGADPTQSCLVNTAYQQENLYTEHTWGSANESGTDPQWPPKKALADTAAAFSTKAMASASALLAGQINNPTGNPGLAVLNPLSWSRTDVVTAPVPSGWNGILIDGSTGNDVAYQSVDGTHIEFVAAGVPADGYRRYELRSGTNTAAAPDGSLSWNPTTRVLQNAYYKVTFSPDGTISSILNANQDELVDNTSTYKLNQYIYRAPGGAKWSPTSATIAQGANGPLSITINVTYPNTTGGKDPSNKSTGVESASSAITLFANTKRISIVNSMKRTQDMTDNEQGFFAFPFKENNPTVTYETPGTPTQLGVGQIGGAAMNWQAMGSYADVSTSTGGVTLSSTVAPMIEFGSIRTDMDNIADNLTPRPGRLDDTASPDLSAVLPTNGSAYSIAFSYDIGTHNRPANSGNVSFDYSITDHSGGFDPTNATHSGWGVQQPLQAASVAANNSGVYTASNLSLASLDSANATVENVSQPTPEQIAAGALPLTFRVLEVAGSTSTTHLTVPYAVTSAQLEDLNGKPLAGGALTVSSSSGQSVITVPVTGHAFVTVGLKPTAAVHASDQSGCGVDGTFMVAAKDSSGSLKVRTWDLTGWSGWTDLGGPNGGTFTGTPAVISYGGHTDVFVRGTDNALWQRYYIASGSGSGWSSWQSLGGVLTSNPAAAVDPSTGQLAVFVRGSGSPQQLFWLKWTQAGWSGWQYIAGPTGSTFSGDPAVTISNGRYDVFVQGTDNALWQNTLPSGGSGWSGWNSLGGTLTSSPGAAYDPVRDLYTVFVRGSANLLYWKVTTTSGWSGWGVISGPTGGIFTGTPAVTSANGRTNVFVQGTDNAAWQNTWIGPTATGWTSIGGTLSGSPGAAYDATLSP